MRTAAFILQIVCLVFSGGGIALYFLSGAGLAFILITSGSVIFAVSTKLYKLSLLKENKRLKSKEQRAEQKAGSKELRAK